MSKPIVVIYSNRPITDDQRTKIANYVDQQIESGKPILLEDRFTVKFYKAEDWERAFAKPKLDLD